MPITQHPGHNTMNDIDRQDVGLWRVFARYCEAVERGLVDIAEKLMAEFVKRLRIYENACIERTAQLVLA